MDSGPIVIVGAGGFGREVLDIIEAINGSQAKRARWDFVGFLDDGDPDTRGRGPVIGPVAALRDLSARYVVAIGDPATRQHISGATTREAAILVHPAATVGPDVVLGSGTVVAAGVRITNHVAVGRHVHLNLNSTVGHDAVLADYVTVYPGVNISGDVHLDEGVSMGTSSSIIQGRRVGAWSIIGAGAAVVRDIPPGVTAVGVPARTR